MSQNDFNIANQGFPSFRSDLNDALQALVSNSSGATEPSTTYAGQFWYDSTNDVLKFRNEANSAWIDPPISGLVTALSDLGVTASAAELNKLDGLLASTVELNYVDGVTSNIQTQLGGKVDTSGDSMTGDLNFGDNDKAIFGAGSDLQIYHDGSNSYIDDTASGSLVIRGSAVYLQKYTGEYMLDAVADGAVTLYHNNSSKLATTATGVDVTGNITASGNVTAYSDQRLKSDIQTISNALETVTELRGVTFNKDGAPSLGLIAQEVQKVLPELVHEGEEYLSLAYGNMVGVLIEAIKQLNGKVEALEAQLQEK